MEKNPGCLSKRGNNFKIVFIFDGSGIASPKLWGEPKNFGGPKCLILRE